MQPEIIICAAVRASDGTVIPCWRHGNGVHTLHGIPGYEDERPHGDDQGFLTSKSCYVSRKEAYRLFVAAGQISVDEKLHPMTGRDELFSEDLY